MTIQNRTVSITGVFAADASTTIPLTPVAGASYRDTTMTGTVVREGWAFKTIVDSSKFNQAMYEYSSITSQIEKYGFLPWSNLTNYETGSLCLGTNGVIYQAKQATGPSTTAIDPTTDSSNTYWEDFVGNTYLKKDASNLTTSGKESVFGWCCPDYANAVSVPINSSQNIEDTYNVTSNGFFLVKNGNSSGFNTSEISINGLIVAQCSHTSTWVEKINAIYPVKSGDSVVYKNITSDTASLYFIPIVGA